MFSPIKNLLTYIQRNASGSTLFGGSQPAIEHQLSDKNSSLCSLESSKKSEKSEKNNKMNGHEAEQNKAFQQNDDSEEDIENQISSNKILNAMRNMNSPSSIENKDKHLDHNQNHNQLRNSKLICNLSDDVDDPLLLRDYHSVESESGNRSDIEHEDVFFDLTSEIGDEDVETILPTPIPYQDREVINVDDPVLNSSLNADMCSEDPLAIDEYNGSDINSNDPNPTAEGEILWINIDTIKRNVTILPDTSPQKSTSHTSQIKKITSDQEIPSDGSDSGLGSETSALMQTTTADIVDASVDTSVTIENNAIDSSVAVENASALVNVNESNLHYIAPEQFTVTNSSPISSSTTSSSVVKTIKKNPLRSNLKRRSNDGASQEQKKPKRSINFESVELYYFPRIQGFTCVPSVGGCTLGMGPRHVGFKTLTLAEHASEIRKAHRLQLQEINPRNSSTEESDSDEEVSEGSGSDLDTDSNGFLQPVSPKQRRVLLKAAGIRKIDANEKADCRDIRNSREFCGCSCRDFCDPDTCACSQAGIKCQVDRLLFPCGCSRDACGNVIGRVEFNPARVRTHFIHTIMRLDMESRHQKRPSDVLDLGGYNGMPMVTASNSENISTNVNRLHSVPNYGNMETSSIMSSYAQSQQHNSYGTQYSTGFATSEIMDTQTSDVVNSPIQHYTGSIEQNHRYEYREAVAALQPPDDNYMDSTSIFPTTSSYGDLLPVHCMATRTNAPTIGMSYYHHTPTANPNSTVAPAATLSAYSAYSHELNSHHDCTTATYLNQYVENNFSSNAVEVGNTNNTNSSAETNSSELKSNASNFIDLNTPVASSSRISAINDLLLNNRNTTATLVAVSSNDSLPVSSLDTPLIELERKDPSFNNINTLVPSLHQDPVEVQSCTPPADTSTNDIDINAKDENDKKCAQQTIVVESSAKSLESENPPVKEHESSKTVDNNLLEDSVPVTENTAIEVIPKSTAIIELAKA